MFSCYTSTVLLILLKFTARLPSITFTLDLVGHDTWSRKYILKKYRLQHDNVDHVVLLQTGDRNCDTTGECLKVLQEMEVKLLETIFFAFLQV